MMRSRQVFVAGLTWLAIAIVAGAAGLPAKLKPPGPQLILIGLTLTLTFAGIFIRPFRRWLTSVDLRIPVAVHLTRFVGFYFLALYQRGELPYTFAVPGGVGDIIVAVLALMLLSTTSPETRKGRLLYLGWNTLGLIDILGVVATAATLSLNDPSSMRALTMLPLSLLVTFLVPITIGSHVLIFARLLRRSNRP
jgi:hypothetical protein